MRATFNQKPEPFFEDVLLNKNLLDEIDRCDPSKLIHVERMIRKLHITPDTLQNAFSEQNDGSFPVYLSRPEILKKLKEAVKNLDKTHPVSYGTLATGGKTIYCTTGLPRYSKEGELIGIRLTSNITTPEDTWTFFVLIDPLTGSIHNFYPLFI